MGDNSDTGRNAMTASESAGVEELRERLTRAEDLLAIHDLMHRWCNSIDYGRPNDYADCFVEDGVLELRNPPRFPQNPPYEGRAAILAFVSETVGKPDSPYMKHIPSSPLISFDGDEADVVSSVTGIRQSPSGDLVVHVAARYTDRMARCPDGRWRLRKRVIEVESGRTLRME